MKRKELREKVVPIRMTARERDRVEKLADKLGISLSAVMRQGMNRFYDEVFKERN